MAKEKGMDEELKKVKAEVQDGKAVIGKEGVIKAIKSKSLAKVFAASNCPQDVKKDVKHYAQLAGVPFSELGISNEELGVLCKKNYFISVLGITGE